MAYWSSRGIFKATVLPATTTNDSATITVGNATIDAISYSGAEIDAALTTNNADINNPTWTNLISLTGGPMLVQFVGDEAMIGLQTSEHDGSESLRAQLLIDSVVVWDSKQVAANADDEGAWLIMPVMAHDGASYFSVPFFCESTLLIRAARKDSFNQAESLVEVNGCRYVYITLK
jgi:hypothetical protein